MGCGDSPAQSEQADTKLAPRGCGVEKSVPGVEPYAKEAGMALDARKTGSCERWAARSMIFSLKR